MESRLTQGGPLRRLLGLVVAAVGCVCVCVCVCVEQGEDVARKGVGVERGLTTPPTAFQQIP